MGAFSLFSLKTVRDVTGTGLTVFLPLKVKLTWTVGLWQGVLESSTMKRLWKWLLLSALVLARDTTEEKVYHGRVVAHGCHLST